MGVHAGELDPAAAAAGAYGRARPRPPRMRARGSSTQPSPLPQARVGDLEPWCARASSNPVGVGARAREPPRSIRAERGRPGVLRGVPQLAAG
jgi:hypothetical protein